METHGHFDWNSWVLPRECRVWWLLAVTGESSSHSRGCKGKKCVPGIPSWTITLSAFIPWKRCEGVNSSSSLWHSSCYTVDAFVFSYLLWGDYPRNLNFIFMGKTLAFQIWNTLLKNGLLEHKPFTAWLLAKIVKSTDPLTVKFVVPQKCGEYHSWNDLGREVSLVFQTTAERRKDLMVYSNFLCAYVCVPDLKCIYMYLPNFFLYNLQWS